MTRVCVNLIQLKKKKQSCLHIMTYVKNGFSRLNNNQVTYYLLIKNKVIQVKFADF